MFTAYINPFIICCKGVLVVLNSLNFCLPVKFLISPSMLNEIFMGRVILVVDFFFFFPFTTLNISCHFLLVCRVSAERSAVNLMGFPLVLLIFFLCF